MIYSIFRKSIPSQFIQVHLSLRCSENETIHLQLPAWRPGRYELENYAQNLKGFRVKFMDEDFLWRKSSKDLWEFQTQSQGIYEVHYEYYCNKMDAGGCWSDDRQLYLNFSNFIFEVQERKSEKIQIQIELEKNYLVATSLPELTGNFWEAENFQHLMDSPLLASPDLKHDSYKVGSSTFHMWFNGEIHFDLADVKYTFKAFTKKQIGAFGDFPSKDYHFIIQLLPYRHYHGVEHRDSTVITFGPAESLKDKTQMDELVGVSSHELYHFWNVCRIRPKELIQYDLAQESYLDTGLVLEGVTTYMGDLYLMKSEYFSLDEYLVILQKQIQKECDYFGWQNQTIIESSFDLWLDGYKGGIPDKKVSIYNRGALICLCLDLMLLDENTSLSAVMSDMWLGFGKTGKGYTFSDFENIVTSKFKNSNRIRSFFNDYIFGKEDIFKIIKSLLSSVGISISEVFKNSLLLHQWGIRTDSYGTINQIHPKTEAFFSLMLGDKIIELNGKKFPGNKEEISEQLELLVERFGRKIKVNICVSHKRFFPEFELKIFEINEKTRSWMK
jgi:predicted metalloprotease with PDZ domain